MPLYTTALRLDIMGFKVLIIGCGAQGKVILSHMVRTTEVEEIRIGDINLGACRKYSQSLRSNKVSTHKVDASNVHEVSSLAAGMDLVVNAVEPRFNLKIMKATLARGANYIDMAFGPPYENLEKELLQNSKLKDAGLIAITGAGGSPGISNVLAACAADQLDQVDQIEIRSYDEVESEARVSMWSPATFIGDCAEPPVVFRNGKLERVQPFSEEETYKFPNKGPRKVYNHIHEEAFSLPLFIGRGIKYVDFKMGSPEMEALRMAWKYGLLSDKPISVKGKKITPRDVFLALTPPTITPEDLETKIEKGTITGSYECVVIDVYGQKDGKQICHKLALLYPNILDVNKVLPGATYESYVVGTACAVLAKMIGNGGIRTRGVVPSEALDAVTRRQYLKELSAQTIPIVPSVKTSPKGIADLKL
jgi:saccharopine dehydrogenase-like NADP-dependent oxidoreductase